MKYIQNMSVVVIFRASPMPNTKEDQQEILRFYTLHAPSMEEVLGVKDIQITLVEKPGMIMVTEYRLSFTILDENVEGGKEEKDTAISLAESIVNLDEDGNYPLRNREFVSGRIMEKTLVLDL